MLNMTNQGVKLALRIRQEVHVAFSHPETSAWCIQRKQNQNLKETVQICNDCCPFISFQLCQDEWMKPLKEVWDGWGFRVQIIFPCSSSALTFFLSSSVYLPLILQWSISSIRRPDSVTFQKKQTNKQANTYPQG